MNIPAHAPTTFRRALASATLAASILTASPASAATPGVDAVIPVPSGWHHAKYPAHKAFLGGQIVDAFQSPSATDEAVFIVASTLADVPGTTRGAGGDARHPAVDPKTTLAFLIEGSTTGAHRVFVTDDQVCNGSKTGALARYSITLSGGMPMTLLVKAALSGPYFVQVAYLRPANHPTDTAIGSAMHDECVPSPARLRALYGHA